MEAAAPSTSCTTGPRWLCGFPVGLPNLSGTSPSTNSNTGSEEQASAGPMVIYRPHVMHRRPIVDCFAARRTNKNTALNRCVGFQVDESRRFECAEQQCPIRVGTKVITVSVLWSETRSHTRLQPPLPFDGNTAAEVSISWRVKTHKHE